MSIASPVGGIVGPLRKDICDSRRCFYSPANVEEGEEYAIMGLGDGGPDIIAVAGGDLRGRATPIDSLPALRPPEGLCLASCTC